MWEFIFMWKNMIKYFYTDRKGVQGFVCHI